MHLAARIRLSQILPFWHFRLCKLVHFELMLALRRLERHHLQQPVVFYFVFDYHLLAWWAHIRKFWRREGYICGQKSPQLTRFRKENGRLGHCELRKFLINVLSDTKIFLYVQELLIQKIVMKKYFLIALYTG